MTAANQHIEIDGGVLSEQVRVVGDASAAFATASRAVAAPIPADAFGIISRGIVVPGVNALAERSRELLGVARELGERVASGTESALTAFSTVEEAAVDTFGAEA